jgi:hypothetical protein
MGRLLHIHDVVPAGWKKPKPGQSKAICGTLVTVAKTG